MFLDPDSVVAALRRDGYHEDVPSPVALIALIESVPEQPCIEPSWLDSQLRVHWSSYAAAVPSPDANPPVARPRDAIESWAVATVSGNETLVQSRPRVRAAGGAFLEDLLRPRTRCTLGAYAATVDGKRPAAIAVPRYHRWVGFVAGDEASPSADAARSLCASLPPFLARARGQAERDCPLFFAFLGCLHAAGGLGQVYPRSELVREALSTLRNRLEAAAEHTNLMVTDGRSFAMLHQSGYVTRELVGERVDRRRSGPVLAGRRTPSAATLVLGGAAEPPTADGLVPRGVFSVDVDTPDRVTHG